MEHEKLKRLKGDIGRRLRKICTHMTEQDFEALVQKIADNEVRAELRVTELSRRPRREVG